VTSEVFLSALRVRCWLYFFNPMRISRLLLLTLTFFSQFTAAQSVTIAQLSDLHIGIADHPGSEQRLQQAIDMVRSRHVDAVVVSGDMGDKFEESWNIARTMLASLRLPVYYVPGNHDDTTQTVSRYTAVFGPNYYTFRVRGINFVALDSQVLGNFSTFQSATPLPVPKEHEPAAERMLAWLNGLRLRGPVIALQHVPPDRPSPQISPDDKPYWILHDPWRTRELDALRKLGVKDILAGHWHQATLYEVDGFAVHVAPATSWSPKSPLGFAIHTINPDGKVKTEFIYFQQQPFLK
jgi:3',5'-cyclic-AMP phosphodiesterase